MYSRRIFVSGVVIMLFAASVGAAVSELADAVMRGNKEMIRSLLQKKADVNAPQRDGTTALHWAVRLDDLETADRLIRAGANISAATRAGATPLQLAAINGNAAMIEKLLQGWSKRQWSVVAIRRHRSDDGGAHGEDRCSPGAVGSRSTGQRERNLGRYDGPDVGHFRGPPGCRKDAH